MPRWTTVKVPIELADRIRKIARARNQAHWQVLDEALGLLEAKLASGYGTRSKPKIEIDLDKVSYYIMKLSYSVTKFKEKPTKENLDWLRKTCSQIADRLGVDMSLMIRAAETYYRTKSKEDYVELNMAWKNAIMQLISLLF